MLAISLAFMAGNLIVHVNMFFLLQSGEHEKTD